MSRTFNGKVYQLWATVNYKRMADSIAKKVKEEDGHSTRVVKSADGYSVYYRK